MKEKMLKFKSDYANGEIDLTTAKMVCIPSKPTYRQVDLALKDGMNYTVAVIDQKWNSFEDRIKLGYEIEKRWNSFPELLEALRYSLTELEDIKFHENAIDSDIPSGMQKTINKVKKAIEKAEGDK